VDDLEAVVGFRGRCETHAQEDHGSDHAKDLLHLSLDEWRRGFVYVQSSVSALRESVGGFPERFRPLFDETRREETRAG
jgi:hypothetical protein